MHVKMPSMRAHNCLRVNVAPLILTLVLTAASVPCHAQCAGNSASSPITSTSEPNTPGARQLVNGQNTTIDLTTPGQVAVNATASGVTSFSSGNLSPLFTTSVATPTTTPSQTFSLSNAGAYTVFGNNTNASAAPAYQSLVTQQLPAGAVVFGGNGGTSGARPLPASGSSPTLTGEYWHVGDYNTNVTSGSWTCNRCRIHVVGNLTISNAITVNTELTGGAGAIAIVSSAGSFPGQSGAGLGAGTGGLQYTGATTALGNGGGGGANGGAGGRGGAYNTGTVANLGGYGGNAYQYEHQLVGSSGGGGGNGAASATTAGAGGAGGGAILFEVSGNVTVGADITATGGAGGGTSVALAAAGGGGSGGTVAIIAGGNITINSAKTINVSGGTGGSASLGANTPGGGGGGGGRFFARAGGTYSNSGTITTSGGGAGSGGASTQAPSAGSSGVSDTAGSTLYSIRTAP